MKPFLVKPAVSFHAEIVFLGDKSIATRAIIISAISENKTVIYNFPASKDCLSTIRVLRQLGVKVKVKKNSADFCRIKNRPIN